jgi:hypothetical protein
MNSQPTQSSLSILSSAPPLNPKSCPTCGQDIPPDKLEEIVGRIAAREREQVLAITAQLEKQYAIEKARAENKAKADLQAEREQSALREARAQDEAEKAAEKRFNDRLAEVEQGRVAQTAEWQRQLAEAQASQRTAEEISAIQKAEIHELQESTAKRIEAIEAEAKQREQAVRDQVRKDAEAAVASRIIEIEKAQRESEEGRIAAEQKQTALSAQLEEVRQAKDAEIEKVNQEKAAEIAHVQQVATREAEARFRETLVAQENAVTEANAKAQEVEAKLAAQAEEHNIAVEASLKAQREVLDKAKDDAVNAEKARSFEETQKLTEKLADVQRALENKTAEELGEGAEIDLYETLKKEFPDDDIHRIPKGTPGADIHHVVMLSGKKCGTILYDSKNHQQFRHEHVTKLRNDQLAAEAEHAILSTRKFPQGTRQLHVQDGVLLANPARVVSIVTILRQHLVQLYTQRVSNIERDAKTAELYEFIVSERCSSLLSRIDERAEDLVDLQKKEIRWHENNWKKEGEAVRGIQKAKADLEKQVYLIIGTSSNDAAA